MRTRALACFVVALTWWAAAPAHADPRADVAAKAKAAMASYDAMDYEAARRQLNQALALAKKAKLDKDPVVAKVYLGLGIALLAGSDQEAAKVALLSAAQIDPKIAIDPAYKSAELQKLLDEAKIAAYEASDPGPPVAPPPSDGVDCRAIRGVRHDPIDAARGGAAQPIEAFVGGDLSPARVVAMYRPDGAIDFTEARLTRQGGCRYTGQIPASAMRGSVVAYYIAAYDASNRVLAAKGSSGAPNLVSIGGGGGGARVAPAPTGDDDPGAGGGGGGGGGGARPAGELSAGAAPSGGRSGPSIFVGFAGGSGLGYVTGLTESGNKVQSCCVGASLVVLTPEVAYRTSERTTVGVAVRLGLPIGANVMGHASVAPSVFVRARHVFSRSGDGFHVMGEIGGGFLRNTIKLDTNLPGMDTDVVAQGPLLFGAGLGYTKRIGGSVAVLLDLDAMAAVAVVGKLGGANRLNSGISGDLSLGVAVGF